MTANARSFGTFEENHYPPTTSVVNITITRELRAGGRSLSVILSRFSVYQVTSPRNFPRRQHQFPDVCPRDKYAGCYQTAAIDTHPPFEQPYITACSRICIYASRIISQLSITSSRLFAGNNGSLLACCSLVPLFLLLPSSCLLSLSVSDVVHATCLSSPLPTVRRSRCHMCVSRDVTHIESIYTPRFASTEWTHETSDVVNFIFSSYTFTWNKYYPT